MKNHAVYIMANARNGTLYTGVTSDLAQRVYQHREGLSDGFTAHHNCKMLVFYEPHSSMIEAIAREKQLKSGSRRKETGADRIDQSSLARSLFRHSVI